MTTRYDQERLGAVTSHSREHGVNQESEQKNENAESSQHHFLDTRYELDKQRKKTLSTI